MSIESTELKIMGQTFKGAWVAVVVAIGSTIGTGVWTASSLYSRLEALESRVIPDVAPIEEKITLIEQDLVNNDVSSLQGKLAALGTNLVTITQQQERLLGLTDSVNELSGKVTQMETTVAKAELVTGKVDKFQSSQDKTSIEISELWQAVDYLSNPLK